MAARSALVLSESREYTRVEGMILRRPPTMALTERIERPGPKRLLAIDGGGIRGVLALEILQKIEDVLRQRSGRADFRLSDYFDFIAGTSTGGIIAACLSTGMSVADILTLLRRRRRGDVHQGEPAAASALQVRERAARAQAPGGVRLRR